MTTTRKTSPVNFAQRLARDIANRVGVSPYPVDPYGPRVRNARESVEHGWMPGALATVTYEDSSVDLISIISSGKYDDDPDLYFEAYSTYLVGVFRK